MAAGRRVSVPALKNLTYTILIKAILSAVMFACMAAAGVFLRTASPEAAPVDAVIVIAQILEFVDIVACVMCLVGISSLSKHFITTHRIMVVVLVMECVLLLLVAAGMRLSAGNYGEAAAVVNILVLASEVAERLLIGAAFLLLMKGFGEVLRNDSDPVSASAAERLGIAYFCFNSVGSVIAELIETATGTQLLPVVAAFFLLEAILEFLIYRRASEAAFRIWRRRAFDILD